MLRVAVAVRQMPATYLLILRTSVRSGKPVR